MTNWGFGDNRTASAAFGRRKVVSRVCVVDSKKHLRAFLCEIIEDDLGLVTTECANADDLEATLEKHLPDIVMLGVSADGVEVGNVLQILVRQGFSGKVLTIGTRESILVKAVQKVGEECGLAMLPPLTTPFAAEALRERISMLIPSEPAAGPGVRASEALHAGWLELWYEGKMDARTLARCGAEASVRMRHPNWGVVAPACFIPEAEDPDLLLLSDFVIDRAIEDWRYLVGSQNTTDISINLPVSFLKNRWAVREFCRRMPSHPAFRGLLIEIDSAEVIQNMDVMIDVAKEIRLKNIAVSIDNLGTDWTALMGLENFPFAELKVDRQFVTGCANDRLKRTVCHRIIELAKENGARVVAEGVETRADFAAAIEMGFDRLQGYLFGKPVRLKKFARASPSSSILAIQHE